MNDTSHGDWWMSIASVGTSGPAAQTAGAAFSSSWKLMMPWTPCVFMLRAQSSAFWPSSCESQNTSSAPAFSASALIESDTIFTNGSESPSEM